MTCLLPPLKQSGCCASVCDALRDARISVDGRRREGKSELVRAGRVPLPLCRSLSLAPSHFRTSHFALRTSHPESDSSLQVPQRVQLMIAFCNGCYLPRPALTCHVLFGWSCRTTQRTPSASDARTRADPSSVSGRRPLRCPCPPCALSLMLSGGDESFVRSYTMTITADGRTDGEEETTAS